MPRCISKGQRLNRAEYNARLPFPECPTKQKTRPLSESPNKKYVHKVPTVSSPQSPTPSPILCMASRRINTPSPSYVLLQLPFSDQVSKLYIQATSHTTTYYKTTVKGDGGRSACPRLMMASVFVQPECPKEKPGSDGQDP